MVHHVTMTYDLANTLYMLIIYSRLATKQSKVFKNVSTIGTDRSGVLAARTDFAGG